MPAFECSTRAGVFADSPTRVPAQLRKPVVLVERTMHPILSR